MACQDTRQLTEAQRLAGYQQQRTGVQRAVRPFTGAPTVDNLIDYINRELMPAVRQTRSAVNDVYNQVRDNAPSGNPLQFYFSTETANADPTTGFIRLDSATQDTATTLRVSQTNGRLQDVAAWLDVMAGGATTPLGTITLFDTTNPGRFVRWDLNTIADQGAYWDLGVSVLESSHDNPFVEGGGVVIAFIPGVAGAGATVPPSAITPVAANTVIANATAGTAAPTAFSVGTNTVLGRVAGNVVAAQLVNAQITDATIANAKLANMAQGTLKGRALAAGTGAPGDLTGLEVGSIARLLSGNSGFVAAGTYNDYAITDGVHVVDIAPSGGDVIFTGFAYGASNTGAFFWLTKFGSGGNVIIRHQNTGSALANRVSTPGAVDFVLTSPGAGALIAFNNTRLQVITGSTLASTFPGAPIYDVMASPFYAVGDGVTDDTTAINAAIAAANATPGMIYTSDAHRITAALTAITGDCVIIQGRGRFAGGTDILVDAASAADWITFSGCQYSGVQDLRIRGVGALYTTGAAVKFDGTYRGSAKRLNISQLADGVDVESSVLTHVEDTGIADLYGSFGVYFHGASGAVAHALHVNHVVCGTDFPAAQVGFLRDWQASTAYVIGNAVSSNGNIYQATVGGTSGATGPSGVPGATVATAHTATITDGSVTWVLAMPQVDWFLHDSYADTFRLIDSGALQGGVGFHMQDSSSGASPPHFARGLNCEFDHVGACGIFLEGGGQAEFEQTFITSMLNGPAIQIGAAFGGDVRFNGGVLFAGGVEGIIVSSGDVILTGLIIGAYGLFTSNTYDAIRVDASVSRFSIENCQTGLVPGSAFPATRYGISIAAGCDSYSVQSNRNVSHATGAILNTPGVATTRLVRNNIPDTATGAILDGDYGDITVSSSGTVWNIDPAVVTEVELSTSVAGAGLVGGAGTPLAVGQGTFISVSANDVAMDWAAFLAATDSTSIVIGSNTYQRAALTGDVTAAQDSNATTIANSAVTNAKMANMTAGTQKGRQITAATGAPVDLTGLEQGENIRVGGFTGAIIAAGSYNNHTIANNVKLLDVQPSGGNVTFTGFAVTGGNTGCWFVLAKFGTGGNIILAHNTTSSAGNLIFTPNGVDYVLESQLDMVLVWYFNGRWQVVSRLVPTTGLTNAAVSLAKMADLAQSRIIGRAEGAGTGAPTALTPAQVVAIIDGEAATWTASHSFTGAAFTVEAASADALIGATAGGVGIFSGQVTANVTNGDLVLNSASGIALNTDGTAVTSVATGAIALTSTTLTTSTTADTTIASTGTGSTIVTGGAQTILAAGNSIDLNSPINLNSSTRLTSILTSSMSANIDDLASGNVNVVRLAPTGGALRLRGMVASADGQLVLLCNTSTAFSFNIIDESDALDGTSSAAANRFRLPNTTTQTLGISSCVWMWYDGTTDRWRMR